MIPALRLSLTPCFSWVGKPLNRDNRFNGLPHPAKTVETVPAFPGSISTQLKQGVNERRPKQRLALALGFLAGWTLLANAAPVEIQLPPEVNAFKQDAGAEIANAQCLICHSVEYVSMQPPFLRSFWKSSVQKMQQKYGATIPDAQVESLVDYLTKNYGAAGSAAPIATTPTRVVQASSAGTLSGPQIAAKYGCFGCHNANIKIVGPAYRDIAAKYKSDPEATAKIQQQISHGGSGKWGPIIMPPFPQVTASETKLLVDWILGLK